MNNILPEFQAFMLGRKSVETTLIYMYDLKDMMDTPQSPLDSLMRGNISSRRER
jgi:hypothetical protein